MEADERQEAVQDRLKELYPSCESDCTDGCKYGCLGWLHRFDPPPPEPARDRSLLQEPPQKQ